jgi:hypothetical protein
VISMLFDRFNLMEEARWCFFGHAYAVLFYLFIYIYMFSLYIYLDNSVVNCYIMTCCLLIIYIG